MSGPKTSSYTLTAEQRRILREQRQKQVELEKIEKSKVLIRSVLARADKTLAKVDASICSNSATLGNLACNLRSLRAELSESIAGASPVNDGSLAAIRDRRARIQSQMSQVEILVGSIEEEIESVEEEYRAGILEALSSAASFTSAAEPSATHPWKSRPEDESLVAELKKAIEAELESLSNLMLDDEARRTLSEMGERVSKISDAAFLKNFRAVTLRPFAKECRRAHETWISAWGKYSELAAEYELCAKTLGRDARVVPFSVEAVPALEAEVSQMREAASQAAERDYIDRCIDEVMEEMGYTVLGSRSIERKGRRIQSDLYEFDEGTAVSVTRSDDGMLTMELGGMDVQDRPPTERECTELVDLMDGFCEDYSEIERRLRSRGVECKRVSILPPSKEYAQIINITDFGLDSGETLFEDRRRRRESRQNRAIESRSI